MNGHGVVVPHIAVRGRGGAKAIARPRGGRGGMERCTVYLPEVVRRRGPKMGAGGQCTAAQGGVMPGCGRRVRCVGVAHAQSATRECAKSRWSA